MVTSIPTGIVHRLRMALGTIQLASEALAHGIRLGDRYAVEVFENLPHESLALAYGIIWRFQRHATQIDQREAFDVLLGELGGMPPVELPASARGFSRNGY